MTGIPRETVLAAMKAIEEETIQRCAAAAREYATRHKGGSNRISNAKANGAFDVATAITKIKRKSV